MRAPRAHSCKPEIVGISGKETDVKRLMAPQFGIGKIRLSEAPNPIHRVAHPVKSPNILKHGPPPSKPASVADLVARGWSYDVVSMTKTHAVVEFYNPVVVMQREARTILRGMLPEAHRHGGHQALRPGKTHKDHESGAWKQHMDNRAAHAELNRGRSPDYHVISEKKDHKKGKGKK